MLLATTFSVAANAVPVKVTLSNGKVFYLESDNYSSTQEMVADVMKLEQTFGGV